MENNQTINNQTPPNQPNKPKSKTKRILLCSLGTLGVLAVGGGIGAGITASVLTKKIKSYSVIFLSEGGIHIPTVTTNYGGKISQPQVTRYGHTLEGWYTTPDFQAGTRWDFEAHTVTSNVTLYANWWIDQHRVSFDLAGGEGSYEAYDVDFGSTLMAPSVTPTKDRCNFLYWTVNGKEWMFEGATNPNRVWADVTLTAKWAAKTYCIVTFDTTGGSAIAAAEVEENGELVRPTDPTRDGYTFGGWYDAPTGGNAIGWPMTVTTSTIIYAQWIPV